MLISKDEKTAEKTKSRENMPGASLTFGICHATLNPV